MNVAQAQTTAFRLFQAGFVGIVGFPLYLRLKTLGLKRLYNIRNYNDLFLFCSCILYDEPVNTVISPGHRNRGSAGSTASSHIEL